MTSGKERENRTLVGVGDVISQQVLERRDLANHNVTRTAKMMSIGFFFVVSPPSSRFLSFISPQMTGGPMLFLGAFLWISRTLNGLTVEENVAKLKRLWPPVQIANFYFIPLHHRLAVVQIVAVAWNSYLSWKANNGCFRSCPTSHI
ncbi:protein Mpv17-like [Salmo trutta]|uniref:protein Mpv17-like n=1 Tax=Salmo trutta TaxID=8032 RepID=UPI00113129E5|nr:protein Mpv17-like [Salmo trutta]